MAIDVLTRRLRIRINGSDIRHTGDPIINESLDSLCRVAEFRVAERPVTRPVQGDTVRIDLLEFGADASVTSYDLFGGSINSIEVSSQPWSMTIRCTDQLELLRRVATYDHDISAMTDGAVVRHILDEVNIAYDPLDIIDMGHTFPASLPLWWPTGVAAGQVNDELDSVFGTKLMTIGNDRVIRLYVDQPPVDATGKYRDFERGADTDFALFTKAKGDRDAIQNWWSVTGYAYPCGTDDACNCTVWANAVAANPQLGSRRTRVTQQTFSSDFITDESVAEFVVRRLMRLTNRQPETATVTTINDPNVHPGTKIGLIDTTYGMGAGSVLLGTVTGVDRTGLLMTLSVIVGDPGNEGTVTHGVEKVCNDTHTDVDNPGGFTPPSFSFPPPLAGVALDPLTINPLYVPALPVVTSSGDNSDDTDGTSLPGEPFPVTWTNGDFNAPGEDWVISTNSLYGVAGANSVAKTTDLIPERSAGVPKPYRVEWDFQASAGGAVEVWGEDSVTGTLTFWFTYFPPPGTPQIYFMTGCAYEGICTGQEHDFGSFIPDAVTHAAVEWDPDALTYTVSVGASVVTLTADSAAVANPVLFSAIQGSNPGETANILDFTITVLE